MSHSVVVHVNTMAVAHSSNVSLNNSKPPFQGSFFPVFKRKDAYDKSMHVESGPDAAVITDDKSNITLVGSDF